MATIVSQDRFILIRSAGGSTVETGDVREILVAAMRAFAIERGLVALELQTDAVVDEFKKADDAPPPEL